ncbi:uncharacterized protein J3D65DRAFT_153352 [Phyllosticta citribraziliensis]|uniref:Uncharacterized protein n=1 Tax=Phyllosticta citribraziliensis TaxID=989973 RepID=A0ABR1L6P8_9PEZI
MQPRSFTPRLVKYVGLSHHDAYRSEQRTLLVNDRLKHHTVSKPKATAQRSKESEVKRNNVYARNQQARKRTPLDAYSSVHQPPRSMHDKKEAPSAITTARRDGKQGQVLPGAFENNAPFSLVSYGKHCLYTHILRVATTKQPPKSSCPALRQCARKTRFHLLAPVASATIPLHFTSRPDPLLSQRLSRASITSPSSVPSKKECFRYLSAPLTQCSAAESRRGLRMGNPLIYLPNPN